MDRTKRWGRTKTSAVPSAVLMNDRMIASREEAINIAEGTPNAFGMVFPISIGYHECLSGMSIQLAKILQDC